MNKKIIILSVVIFIIFMAVILGINLWLKRYSTEPQAVVPQAPAKIIEEGLTVARPQEEKKITTPQSQEEPEKEAPLQSNVPLVN